MTVCVHHRVARGGRCSVPLKHLRNEHVPKARCLAGGAAVVWCSIACAQPRFEGAATWSWLVSADAGQSWRTGVAEVPQSQSSVLVRASCVFDQFPDTYYGNVQLDPFVAGVGPGDSITNIGRGELPTNLANPLATFRFDDLIKIDYFLDDLPPGVGSFWATLNQFPPTTGEAPRFSNPIWTMNFTLNLDGTPGERRIDAVFRVPFVWEPLRQVLVYEYTFILPTRAYLQELHDFGPAIVRVVPAPGAAAVVGVLTVAAMARRRRGQRTRPRP